MQTILGANGVIANQITKELPRYTDRIRLVSRHPEKINESDDLVVADLTDYKQTEKAVSGSEIVYLTVGLTYNLKIWSEKWPLIMQNVIDACKKHGSKLVFFDNVYMYGKVNGWMTENSPYNPCSKKGEIRANIATMLMDEVQKGNLKAQIARAADFYGKSPLSFIAVLVLDKFAKQKSAQYMVSDQFKHSYTYIPDAGKATALLGNTESAYNQVWHLPTDKNVLTGKDFIKLAADVFDCKPNYMILKKWMVKLAGMANPIIKETLEMMYQLEGDYMFDSSKFDSAFDFKSKTYREGLTETALEYGI